MNKKGFKNTLNITEKQFEILKSEFTKSEKIDIIKSVIYGVLLGKSIGQVICEISYENSCLIKRNYKKLNEILNSEKRLIAMAFKEILSEKYRFGGAL